MIKGQRSPRVVGTPAKSKHVEAHASNQRFGMGDNYGTGVRAPLGKMRSGLGVNVTPKAKLKNPPRSLA